MADVVLWMLGTGNVKANFCLAIHSFFQCGGSVNDTDTDPYFLLTDLDPDPTIFVSDLVSLVAKIEV
jgi:hypothetical protein